ncbi:PmoA family protein [Chitinophaga nivalis]|uniref:PmoA family protein n=1 Tax=Chitinophaga nivalis TaxID=2991709 RepID=A0ABT3IR69_9BACT|nr:PmoA family protein [Chitinophaga nivalis]MCW3463834.1 PmoA family protein [Chitinophaga nivalis]MCW3486476.1 PmoA family protein [Chitinophaga nivalis]
MKTFILFYLLLLTTISAGAQHTTRFRVKAGPFARENSVIQTVFVPADTTALALIEITDGKRTPVPVNIMEGGLCWVMSGYTPAGAEREYELLKTAELPPSGMQATIRDGAVVLQEGPQAILQYNFNTVSPPPGTDTVYNRSGFIHPLWAPNGAVLTQIFPNAGHRHHMGIWNPWTHTLFEGKETDFWNVQKKQGKVRFSELLGVINGGASCGFAAHQEHVAFLADGTTKTAINEVWVVQAFPATHGGSRREWDFTSILTPASDSGITLLQYRYGGGFGLRATPAFTATTSQVLTSEGKTRKDADSTRARWVKITGNTPAGKAGMLIMNYPGNYDSPEALRVWPENMEGGELMLNYSPTRMTSWFLKPEQTYLLKYRVMVYNGDITATEAEAAWQEFAHPPDVIVEH